MKNTGREALEIGDLALPLPMNTDYVWDHEETFVRRVFRHAFIAGHGSFLYWLPVKGSGSFLVMQPQDGTRSGILHGHGHGLCASAGSGSPCSSTPKPPRNRTSAAPGASRAPAAFSSRARNPPAASRSAGRTATRACASCCAKTAAWMCRWRPAWSCRATLTALLALRTTRKIESIGPEFPADTKVEYLGERGTNTHLYRVKFSKLGENLLTVRGAGGWTMPLEFFVTEPLETLIKKRAAFIVKNQQHRDPGKWYDGLYSLWDRRQPAGRNLLGPDHLAGQHPYAVSGSDDPSNSKCLLVAEKNVAFPDAAEIASLEYFIKHFVWGKHQRTDAETPYPYGIYGSDSWKQNRFTDRDPLDQGISRPGGPSACRMWRTFDYTTYFALYFNLYRIAKQRPDLVKELQRRGIPGARLRHRPRLLRGAGEHPHGRRLEFHRLGLLAIHRRQLPREIPAAAHRRARSGRPAGQGGFPPRRVGEEGEVFHLRPSLAVRLGDADRLHRLRIHLRRREVCAGART